ncbi:UvrD-helicase domain-containing protein [Ralstonia pseudosolanacearum]|uniref:UvrD-helicase domain-containing protein n=1 Tax=Ralstonia pseudosolanacearum TaxID=1310165 RepID=UPI002006A2AE|nr:UvrD-helicase domain-containing protein [Ralstonia pseudosolanacearum]MCK4143760.1 UvrD-helicase domain-containing protein [Ralstonia pseudosolanacearum]
MLEEVVKRMLSQERGAVEAPAGAGKTEQIAVAVSQLPGRWLVLTHTVAGVEALRRRLGKHGVTDSRAHVDTISAWAYRWARAYPLGSGFPAEWSAKSNDWEVVHRAATTLISSGAVASVLAASYAGAFVDEYQDCTSSQHALMLALADIMRCYVFGDPLQAIFGFDKGERLVDWQSTTLASFPLAGRLETPHRWQKAKNAPLGEWLLALRPNIKEGMIDLSSAPACVRWTPCSKGVQLRELARMCAVQGKKSEETLVVLDASERAVRRADLAKQLGGTTIEPVSGKCERAFYAKLSVTNGMSRAEAVLEFASTVFVGIDSSVKKKRIASILQRPGRQKTAPSSAELALCTVAESNDYSNVLSAIDCLANEPKTKVVRPELLFSVKAALRAVVDDPSMSLDDAAWQIATLKRLRGRVVRDRSVGSTLLVKGLEFDHVVITPEACTSPYEWYVALTRATKSIRVLAPSQTFTVK